MNGLALSKKYYEEYAPHLVTEFPQLAGRMAFGLVGEGSQCFGFDDEISRDHDFGPGFCIWLSDEDYVAYGKALQSAYDSLPKDFEDFRSSDVLITAEGAKRLGVFSISGFYERFLGTGKVPEEAFDWLLIPEGRLAVCTNGEVFDDPQGLFTAFRMRLLDFYPEDAMRKKIAARAAVMSQSGQYNLLRSIKRRDITGASLAAAKFAESTLSMIHLLNRRYTPFYKWAFHSAMKLEHLTRCCPLLERIWEIPHMMKDGKIHEAYELAFDVTENICIAVAAELNRHNFSREKSAFLQDHLHDIMSGIKDPKIASLPPMADIEG